MKDHQRALAALAATIAEHSLPEPAYVVIYAPNPKYLTANAVYSDPPATLIGPDWRVTAGGTPVSASRRDGVVVELHAAKAVAA